MRNTFTQWRDQKYLGRKVRYMSSYETRAFGQGRSGQKASLPAWIVHRPSNTGWHGDKLKHYQKPSEIQDARID